MKDILQGEWLIEIRDKLTALTDKLQKITIFNRTPGKKVIIISFAAIILALALFSAVTLIDVSSDGEDETTTELSEIDPAVLGLTDVKPIKADFLFALTDSDKAQVISAMVVGFDSEKATATYYFLPTGGAVSVSGIYDSFSGHLQSGGTPQLILAASEYTGVEFDRYAVVSEDALGGLLARLGETTVEIDRRVSYEHKGVSFIIEEGTQTLTPDMLLKYFIYLLSDTQTNGKKIADLMVGMIEKITSSEDDAVLEADFCFALGCFDTSISALDFNNNKETIKAIKLMNLRERAFQVNPEAVAENKG